jgi:tRNA(Ile2)-agmatinylcytidine synthase
MTIIGIDDTDSRESGMCTTYIGLKIAQALEESNPRLTLVRLNPGVKYKTRGNASVAIHLDCNKNKAFRVASKIIGELSELSDSNTQPGLVVAHGEQHNVSEEVSRFCIDAIRTYHKLETAIGIIDEREYLSRGWNGGRGLIGALAAVGARGALDEWTYEYIAYREEMAWGTIRDVNSESVRESSREFYPYVWDSFDETQKYAVCVPRTPCPVLYGIRGETPEVVEMAANGIISEPVGDTCLFSTNQGTDSHIQHGEIGSLKEGHSYTVEGIVSRRVVTKEGGHVFFGLKNDIDEIYCAAFEPTKQFRNHVRMLEIGDRIKVCGGVTRGTLKLEKFQVQTLIKSVIENPICNICGRKMESTGRFKGYRCKECKTFEEEKRAIPLERRIQIGWYEVPPCARRHLSKPLVRGGFGAEIHPEI